MYTSQWITKQSDNINKSREKVDYAKIFNTAHQNSNPTTSLKIKEFVEIKHINFLSGITI